MAIQKVIVLNPTQAPGLLPNEFSANVALGLLPGFEHFEEVGQNDVITNAGFIILSNATSAANPTAWPSSAQQMQIVSSSANDAANGTGTQQVTIIYLRDPTSEFGFTETTEVITLNGITPVNTIATNIFRINEFTVNRTGSQGFSDGDISLQSVGGGSTYEIIAAKTNRHRTITHFVPKGKGSFLTRWQFGTVDPDITCILEKSVEDPNGNIVTHGVDQIDLNSRSIVIPTHETIKNPNGKLMFFTLAVKSKAGIRSGSGSIHFIDFDLDRI